MKQNLLTGIMCMTLILAANTHTCAQVQFWQDDFEGTAPSYGTRVPSNDGGVGGPPYTSYFCRTPATSTVSQSVPFTGFQGTNYWAGEDHDAAGTGFAGAGTPTTAVRVQTITWPGIIISGKTGLSFTGSLAANSTNQPWDNRNACSGGATTNTDYIIIQYQIDGGPVVNPLKFFTNGALTGKYLFQENTGDSCGDGTQLTNVFQDFSFSIPTTGNTMDLRLLVHSEGGNEEWGADNFRLSRVTALPVTWGGFTARNQGDDVVLDWSTLSEQNTESFIVQHNSDGSDNWENLVELPAARNSQLTNNYSYVHHTAANGKNFYRIKQTDLSGDHTYTNIQTVRIETKEEPFVIMTNPVENGKLSVRIASPITLRLYNIQGSLVSENQVIEDGVFSIPVSNLSKGIYILKGNGLSKRVVIR